MQMIDYYCSAGILELNMQGGRLAGLQWLDNRLSIARQLANTSQSVQHIFAILDHYFLSAQIKAEVPMVLDGTPFQRRVWQALQSIPSGQTKTYGQLAKELGTSSRAIGQACKRNAIAIFIPCHRVVASNGIGGFMGSHRNHNVEYKRWLLAHEGVLN